MNFHTNICNDTMMQATPTVCPTSSSKDEETNLPSHGHLHHQQQCDHYLRPSTFLGAVTCVAWSNNNNDKNGLFLWYSQGPYLHVTCPTIHGDTPSSSSSLHVMDDATIHGIRFVESPAAATAAAAAAEKKEPVGTAATPTCHEKPKLDNPHPQNEKPSSNVVLVWGGRHVAWIQYNYDCVDNQEEETTTTTTTTTTGSKRCTTHATTTPSLQLIPWSIVNNDDTRTSTTNNNSNKNTTSSTLSVTDWIWEARLVPRKDSQPQPQSYTLWLGLAHNQVQEWQIMIRNIHSPAQQASSSSLLPTTTTKSNHPAGTVVVTARPVRTIRAAASSSSSSSTSRFLAYCTKIHLPTGQVAVGSVTQGIAVWNIPATSTTTSTTTDNMPDTGGDNDKQGTRLHWLRGHKGAVHALCFDKTGRRLVSASDDRSICLWQQQQEQEQQHKPRQPSSHWTLQWTAWGHQARCVHVTFVDNQDASTSSCATKAVVVVSTAQDGTARVWNVRDGSCRAVIRGHASLNIWSCAATVVNVPTNCFTTTAKATSSSSTSTTPAEIAHSTWLAIGADQGTVALVPIESKGDLHQSADGKGDANEQATITPFSGSTTAASSTGLNPFQFTTTIPDDRPIVVPALEIPDNKNRPNPKDGPAVKKAKPKVSSQIVLDTQFCADIPSSVQNSAHSSSYVEKNQLVVATRNGALHSWDWGKNIWTTHAPWYSGTGKAFNSSGRPETNSSSIQPSDGLAMAKHPHLDLVAIGLRPGEIWLVGMHGDTSSGSSSASSIRAVLPALGQRAPSRLAWLRSNTLAAFYAKSLRLWTLPALESTSLKIDVQSCTNSDDILDNSTVCTFSSGLAAVITCTALPNSESNHFRSSKGDAKQPWIATGDNRGHICIYKTDCSRPLDTMKNDEAEVIIQSPLSIRRIHGREHVNDIVWTGSASLVSVGNDGMMCQSRVSLEGKLEHDMSLPVLSFSSLIRIWPYRRHDTDSLEYYVAGYTGNILAVADVATGYEFARVDTGGRGRGTTVDMEKDGTSFKSLQVAICANRKDGLNDIHLERHAMRFCQERNPFHWSLGTPFHHDTIFDVCAFPLTSESVAVVTGSEDCSSRISLWSNGSISFSKQLTPQESGVRAVCHSTFSDSRSTLIVIGGSKLVLQFFVMEHGNTSDVNGSFCVRLLGQGKPSSKVSIDHRINALRATRLCTFESGTRHVIASGDSNGKINLYTMEEDCQCPSKGTCIWETTRPILSLDWLAASNSLWLVAGTSGGKVYIFDLTAVGKRQYPRFLSPVLQYQAHAMGVNVLSANLFTDRANLKCTRSDQDFFWVASGGDDQRLTICQVFIQPPKEQEIDYALRMGEIKFANEASVSAIRSLGWIGDEYVTTVGYGGRLALWHLSKSKGSDDADGNAAGSRHIRLQLRQAIHVQVGDVNSMAVVKLPRHDAGDTTIVAVAGYGLQLFQW